MIRLLAYSLLTAVLATPAFSQEPGHTVPSVSVAPVGKVHVSPGGTANVEIDFRVGSEFHINSNKPKSELLIPTVLKLGAPEPLSLGTVKYPAGQDVSFPFAPDEKLNVYSGDFSVTAVVKAATKAASGDYPVSGELRFQACDRSACYPPRSIPVKFEVSVGTK